MRLEGGWLMPNKAAKFRKQERKKRHQAIKKWKREQKRRRQEGKNEKPHTWMA